MNASSRPQRHFHRPAHPLFAADQAFLWLPGFAGEEIPYCSYNEHREEPARLSVVPECDENGASYVPPYPVSGETHITWHTDVSPPYPYHPVPVARSLSREELVDLGRNVIEMLEPQPDTFPDPVRVLRNQYKSYILAALARMNLLPGLTQTLLPVG